MNLDGFQIVTAAGFPHCQEPGCHALKCEGRGELYCGAHRLAHQLVAHRGGQRTQEQKRRWRACKLAQGLCQNCGRQPHEVSKTICADCRASMAARYQQIKARR